MAANAKRSATDTTEAVERWLAASQHPHLDAIRALRDVILGADPAIGEGVKWNAPSFRTTDHFATIHPRARTGIGLILHRGAKKRSGPAPRVADPDGRLEWLADDRAMLTFADAADVRRRRASVRALIRAWLETT